MPYAICPYCKKKSYSAAMLAEWVCPYCGQKIKGYTFKDNMGNENNNLDEQDK
ncbi:MAG: hypothetical protein GX977_15185 [Firmicutes bacterium]|nr:hypothetical protein [Bacillota bacterium]HHY13763.1 hypothetical protein [Thermoanaerobacterales bacterium]